MPPIGKKEDIKTSKTHCCKCFDSKIVKAGLSKNKKQRYKCTNCRRRFVRPTKKEVKYKSLKQELMTELYLEGLGIRSIARILKISHVTVQHWIKQKGKRERLFLPLHSAAVEIDEIYFYTKKKKHKRWLWIAVCKNSKQILAYQTGTRGKSTLKKLMAKLTPIKIGHYYTDTHVSFKGIIPSKKHTASKRYTTTVEGVNSAIRHYIARFQGVIVRKSAGWFPSEGTCGRLRTFWYEVTKTMLIG